MILSHSDSANVGRRGADISSTVRSHGSFSLAPVSMPGILRARQAGVRLLLTSWARKGSLLSLWEGFLGRQDFRTGEKQPVPTLDTAVAPPFHELPQPLSHILTRQQASRLSVSRLGAQRPGGVGLAWFVRTGGGECVCV